MSNESDKLVDEYLSGAPTPFSAHYRRIEAKELPQVLDRAVLEVARKANLESRKRINWRRFSAPLALAATVALTLSIVMRTRLDAPISSGTDSISTELSTKANGQTSAAPPPTLVAAPEQFKEEPNSLRAKKQHEPVDAQSPPRPSSVPARKNEENAAAKLDSLQVARRSLEREKSEQPRLANAQAPGVLPRATQPAPLELNEVVVTQSIKTDKRSISGASASPEVSSSASMKENAAEIAESKTVESSYAVDRYRSDAVSTAVSAKKNAPQRSPEEWLKFIRQLRGEGKQTDADEQWKLFVVAYPNYKVTESDVARPH